MVVVVDGSKSSGQPQQQEEQQQHEIQAKQASKAKKGHHPQLSSKSPLNPNPPTLG